MKNDNQPKILDYNPTSFSQGRMDFTWEKLTDDERQQAYDDWQAGKGLIGGNPLQRPGADLLPKWGLDQPFIRVLAQNDPRGNNGERLREALVSDRALEVEIGFGRADFLLDRATRYPDRLFLGYETKTKATRLCLQRLGQRQNFWASDDDCRFSLPRLVENGRVDTFHILFPDPWWKPQHQVKRIFSPPFVDMLADKLRTGGLLFFRSDVEQYNEWVRYLMAEHGQFKAHSPAGADRIGEHVPTHREHWCIRKGRPVFSSYFERV